MIIRCLCATAACCLGLSGSAVAQTAQPSRPSPAPAPQSPLVSDATVRPDDPAATSPVEEKAGFFRSLLASINSNDEGWTPSVGSVASGGGVAFGTHYRQPLASRNLFMDAEYLVSLKGYQSATLDLSSRPLANGLITVGGGVRFQALPQEDFFGFGPDSSTADHASYNRQGLDTQGWVAFQPKSVAPVPLDLRLREHQGQRGPSVRRSVDRTGVRRIARRGHEPRLRLPPCRHPRHRRSPRFGAATATRRLLLPSASSASSASARATATSSASTPTCAATSRCAA